MFFFCNNSKHFIGTKKQCKINSFKQLTPFKWRWYDVPIKSTRTYQRTLQNLRKFLLTFRTLVLNVFLIHCSAHFQTTRIYKNADDADADQCALTLIDRTLLSLPCIIINARVFKTFCSIKERMKRLR